MSGQQEMVVWISPAECMEMYLAMSQIDISANQSVSPDRTEVELVPQDRGLAFGVRFSDIDHVGGMCRGTGNLSESRSSPERVPGAVCHIPDMTQPGGACPHVRARAVLRSGASECRIDRVPLRIGAVAVAALHWCVGVG